ncbi:MAG: type IV secretory system conjugative DNA transfer family protein [Caulobacteraceae bacterium]|nr:type IV secretory system conjugative DNA transfer family protein [Caulobacteraceae bacterium]
MTPPSASPRWRAHAPRSILGWRKGSTTIREERRPLLLPADVRALPRDEELIFVSGAKPIRAKKLKFDQESVFVERLRPASGNRPTLTTTHDWAHVRALGVIPQVVKTPKAKPAMSRPLADQPDLFAQAATRSTQISDAAMAAFRDADGAALPHPASVAACARCRISGASRRSAAAPASGQGDLSDGRAQAHRLSAAQSRRQGAQGRPRPASLGIEHRA